MITIDETKGLKANYEVILKFSGLTVQVLYHYYIDARELFMNAVNEHIQGITIWLNDLTGLTDC